MYNARNALRRFFTILVGFTVMILGAVLVPLPGPGLIIFLAGVAILAREFHWARRLLNWGHQQMERANDEVHRRTGRKLPEVPTPSFLSKPAPPERDAPPTRPTPKDR